MKTRPKIAVIIAIAIPLLILASGMCLTRSYAANFAKPIVATLYVDADASGTATRLSWMDAFTNRLDNSPTTRSITDDLGPCDAGLAIDSSDPVDAAQAIEICKIAAGPSDWGLLSASWVLADGTTVVSLPNYELGHGLFPGFGTNVSVRKGQRLLALSSGTARQPTDPGYYELDDPGFEKGYSGNHPDGFPKAIFTCLGSCPVTGSPYDDAALEVVLRVPPKASGFAFDFKFYTTDYPDWTCSTYNDWFVAMLDPIPDGLPDGNIAFDPMGNPVRANDDLLKVCAPDDSAACYTCPLGTSELQGTGFEGHAGSSWLTATGPARAGTEITLRFAIYDSGDYSFDSTVLIDNFRWLWLPDRVWLPLVYK
jgi:hypothetical protein